MSPEDQKIVREVEMLSAFVCDRSKTYAARENALGQLTERLPKFVEIHRALREGNQ